MEPAKQTSMMSAKYRQWFDRLPLFARQTEKATVICFKINVNQGGFGFIKHMSEAKGVDTAAPWPCQNVEAAIKVLRDAWERAAQIANEAPEQE